MNITPNITWNSVLSPDAFLELKYSGFYGFFDLIPISEGPASFDLGTGRFTDAYWAHYTFDRARTNFQGNVSYFAEDFAGSHSFKFGLEYENLKTDDQARYGLNGAGEGIIYYPYFGDPYPGLPERSGLHAQHVEHQRAHRVCSGRLDDRRSCHSESRCPLRLVEDRFRRRHAARRAHLQRLRAARRHQLRRLRRRSYGSTRFLGSVLRGGSRQLLR